MTGTLGEDLLTRAATLRATLARWKGLAVASAGRTALAYLPDGAKIQARIYPVIKPASNSFVFEGSAIFLSLDPLQSPEVVENILVHELHHIGYGSAFPEASAQAAIQAMPEGTRQAYGWISAFGRPMLLDCMRDPHLLLPAFNRAVQALNKSLSTWSPELVRVLAGK
jgi:hypothetical protein